MNPASDIPCVAFEGDNLGTPVPLHSARGIRNLCRPSQSRRGLRIRASRAPGPEALTRHGRCLLASATGRHALECAPRRKTTVHP